MAEPNDPSSSPEEREESQDISREAAAREAGALLRRRRDGVLSTLSRKYGGFPFGSVAPYALDARGQPLIYVATIAEHTRNLLADERASLLVQEDAGGGDVQAHGRVTLLVRGRRVEGAALADVRARYVARVPAAVSYAETHDFVFFRLELERARFIGGFGRIFWLEAEELLEPAADPLAAGARGIVEHMNTDHSDALLLYCRAFKQVSPTSARMVGVDRWGFDVECTSPDVRLRFDFDAPVSMETIRGAVVELVKRARGVLSGA